MQRPVTRRAWIAAVASAGATLVSACQPASSTELKTPEGRVLQWEGDDLLVLVSGLQDRYRPGDTIRLNVLVNNQSTRSAQIRVRTRLLGRGDQAVAEAEVATLTVRPEDAAGVDRELALGRSLPAGDYTLSVEVPPWQLDGRDTGRGAVLRGSARVDPAP